jgi:UDP-N-acetylmuramoylalanine--D-glutamate ligase
VVMLSPAAASMDQFKNFEHRGDVFVNLVQNLATLGGGRG